MNKFLFGLMFAGLALLAAEARAGITTIQALSFGNYVVANNNSVQTVTVSLSGNVTASSGLLEITPTAQQGIYDIDGLTPNAAIASVDVTALTTMRGVNISNEFTLGGFTSNHTNADPAGVARVTIGGTASTTGNGLGYPDQTYSATVEIQINYL
ncbi:MAG: DUF4402 domain-containing protein [Pseudomonadales bacterium]|nr:DUF4402 domain-containing protein [Pseudomonadales bacterium]